MFKSLANLYFLSSKSLQGPLKKPIYKSFIHNHLQHQFTTQNSQAAQLLITQAIKNCNTVHELFFCFDRYRRGLNLIHLCVILNKFNTFQKITARSPFLENFHNEIVNSVIDKYERNEEELNTQTLTSLYYFMSHNDYENLFTKRCNFLLEQRGIESHKEMKDQEFVGFVSALAKNNKKPYIFRMVPYIIQSIDGYSLGKLTMIVNCLAGLGIKSEALALKTKDYLMNTQGIEKLRPVEYSQILSFFSGYPEIEDPEFFKRMEKRAQLVSEMCDLNSFIMIIDALESFEKKPMGRNFYKNIEKRFNDLVPELSDEMMYKLFMDFCYVGCATFVVSSKVSSEAMARSDRFSQNMMVNVFINLSKSKRLTLSLLKRYTEVFAQKGINEISSGEYEQLLLAYTQFFKDIQAKPSTDVAQVLGKFFIKKLSAESDRIEIDRIFSLLKLFEKSDQESICTELQQDRVMNQNNIDFLGELMKFMANECPQVIQANFVEHIIDLLNENASLDQSFLEGSAEILHVLTEQEVNESVSEKRTRLFRSLEKVFLKLYKNQPEELLTESKLFIYLFAFYSSTERPRPELEEIFHEALKNLSVQDFTNDHIKFLEEKTHLLDNFLEKDDEDQSNHLNMSF